ncbi:MAG TPA: hypothetical protein ENK55_05585 [Actinobacteria bacterium]|nr:hypothetical protein [Actinomycetota bacterium]
MTSKLRRVSVIASSLAVMVSSCTGAASDTDAGMGETGIGGVALTSETTLPITDIHGYAPQFGSVEEMAAASDLIVVASVVALEPLGALRVDEDPNPSEWTVIRFAVGEVLAGAPVDEVSLMWEAFATDGEGRRVLQFTLDGIPLPQVGDRYLLFLEAESEARAAVFEGRASHRLVIPAGMMAIVDGRVASEYRGGSPVGKALDGLTVDRVTERLGEPPSR